MKKTTLSLPPLIFTVVLVGTLVELIRFLGAFGTFFMLIIHIPFYISFIISVFLTAKILKGNTAIKDWNCRSKAAYIAVYIFAMLIVIGRTASITYGFLSRL